MAQQYIKIFDDTVLKQSVNQGYEIQRINSRLGQFTMGELAFTRDTARLFVGNYTNLNNTKDSDKVLGGSLVGNKYLGLIDSKPLTHYKAVDSTGSSVPTCVYLPLNYETSTFSKDFTNSQGTNFKYEEKGLLTKDSKFRTDKNNGWNKEATYNEKYDAYNGDFIFDVYNNALILFDSNIKPIPSTQNRDWDVDPTTKIQKFKKPDNTIYTETGNKSNYSTKRTRLQNAEKNDASSDTIVLGNPDYPIYGDGYVVMRIVEPDGITLGYVEKEFNQNDGTAINGNYSHNYVEIKSLKTQHIFNNLNENHFKIDNGKISLTDGLFNIESDDLMPNELNFESGFTLNFANTNQGTGYLYVKDTNGNVNCGYPTITIELNGVSKSCALTPGNHKISFDDVNDEDITIGDTNEYYLVKTPFFSGSNKNYIYSGAYIFDSSSKQLLAFEEVPEIKNKPNNTLEDTPALFCLYDSSGSSTYTTEQVNVIDGNGVAVIDEKDLNYSGTFVHPYVNVGYNFLKEPEPIAWGTGGAAQGQFFIEPYVVSPTGLNSNMATVGKTDPVIAQKQQWTKALLQGIESPANLKGTFIPDHAQSIICELHVPTYYLGKDVLCITTAYDWRYCVKDKQNNTFSPNGSSNLFGTISLTAVPTVKSSFTNFKHIKILRYHHVSAEGHEDDFTYYHTETVEIPLYRDKNGIKYFNVGIISPRAWVLRAIGYRA